MIGFAKVFIGFAYIFIGWPSSGGPRLIIIRERDCPNQGIIMEVLLRCSCVFLRFSLVVLRCSVVSLGLHLVSLGFRWFP